MATVAATWLQVRGESTVPPGAVSAPRVGSPPLEFNFGLRTDAQARALERAAALYNAGRHAQAAEVFARYRTLPAEIGAAFADWHHHGLDALEQLAAQHPASALALLHLGLAYYWTGLNEKAVETWKRAETAQPDSPFALAAGSLLHPNMPSLPLPQFTPQSPLPRALRDQPLRQQLATLHTLSKHNDITALLYYGVALQELGHRLSAEREFAKAAALAPNDPEALTAAAVGRFSKDNPSAAFSHLGPLATRFPHAAVVRFHLGYLLIWINQRSAAAHELRLALTDDPHSVYAHPARLLLQSLTQHKHQLTP